jgi:malonate-semialdehyde dehydrogenase (acetylating)/methylmalonate-semialdehyde dehydrogenase
MGNGLDPNTDLGPLISPEHKDRVASFIAQGLTDGADLLLDGREAKVDSNGNFLGASIFTNVKSNMSILKEEIFGPVMCITRADNLDHAISMIQACPLANATSIFTRSGAAARKFKHDVGVSMIGVNIGVAAPMAYFPFGGTKNSFFGDIKAHGNDAVRFYTDAKVVISRWF